MYIALKHFSSHLFFALVDFHILVNAPCALPKTFLFLLLTLSNTHRLYVILTSERKKKKPSFNGNPFKSQQIKLASKNIHRYSIQNKL